MKDLTSRTQIISTPSGYARFEFPWPLSIESYEYIKESLRIQLNALEDIALACEHKFIGPKRNNTK